MRFAPGQGGHVWYFQDGRGNVSHLADDSNNLIERYTYDVYGMPTFYDGNNTLLGASAYDNRFLFEGSEYLPDLSMYDMRNRIYYPGIGRFLQTDPVGFQGDRRNLYRYCGNDPVDRSDPMGLFELRGVFLGYAPGEGLEGPGRDLAQRLGANNLMDMLDKLALTLAITSNTLAQSNGIHDPIINGKHYDQSSNYQALGHSAGIKAEEQLQKNPSEHEELSIISQKKDGSKNFIASPPAAQYYNPRTQKNESYVYDRNDPRQVDPSPSGYRAVANVVAQILWAPQISRNDRNAIHATGLDGFIAVPHQPGTNGPIVVRFYNEGNVSP
jgi:RHS repeat-associated protein